MKVQAARSLGIALKRFEGWEPRTETVHEYDSQGRLIRSVTTTETEWDEQETAWMLALAEYEADTCSGCNGRLSQTTIPEGDPEAITWDVPPPVRCHRCTALAVARDQHEKTPHPHALMFIAKPKD